MIGIGDGDRDRELSLEPINYLFKIDLDPGFCEILLKYILCGCLLYLLDVFYWNGSTIWLLLNEYFPTLLFLLRDLF